MKNNAARKLKQVSAGYLTVGIDPHKKKHAAVAITEDLIVRAKFKFANSRNGFENALEKIRAEMIKDSCRGVIFAIETGGHFWRNFAYFLEERGLPFRLISQITLKRMRDGRDLIGARVISEMPKWLPEYCVPVTSPKQSFPREFMLTFGVHTAPISDWSKKGPGSSIS